MRLPAAKQGADLIPPLEYIMVLRIITHNILLQSVYSLLTNNLYRAGCFLKPCVNFLSQQFLETLTGCIYFIKILIYQLL